MLGPHPVRRALRRKGQDQSADAAAWFFGTGRGVSVAAASCRFRGIGTQTIATVRHCAKIIVAFRAAKERSFAERKATIGRLVLAQRLKWSDHAAALLGFGPGCRCRARQ